MTVELTPEEVELVARVVRAYGLHPAERDRPVIEHVLEALTPSMHERHIAAVA